MKLFLLVVVLSGLLGISCDAMLERKASANSYPIKLDVATTNDLQTIAWLQLASRLNQIGNPTPTQEPISVAIGAAIGIISAFSGWWARHNTSRRVDTRPPQ